MESLKTGYTFLVELFQSSVKNYEPLASRMRPRNLAEYIGQEHILGPGRLLRRSIEADKLTSVIFSGPPGTGKTTLARVVAQATRGAFLSVNAVLSGVKEIRELIEKAQENRQLQGRKTILFVDEVHRWNKSQQDALLPWVENGTFILIGATTENPFFEVNSALVSRSRVFQLRPLSDANLEAIALQALNDPERGYGHFPVTWAPGALDHLIRMAAGDARSLLNALELAVETSSVPFPPPRGTPISIDLATAEESIQKKAVLYDKDGDYHFDTISAFIKSLRGSDPDASLYWLARMVRAGEDPGFLFRRMLILASEDVGLADPQALVVVQAASEAFRKVGLPEGQFHLAQAALYLATCSKSNSTLGYFEALKSLETEVDGDVPSPLKDASRDGEAFQHGQGYLYPHSFRDHWVSQQYLPRGMEAQIFYQPSDQGYEGSRREEILQRRELVLHSAGSEDEPENLTWAKPSLTPWVKRLSQDSPGVLADLRAKAFELAGVLRHHLVWVACDPRGFFLQEALRRAPEGRVWASLPDAERQQVWENQLSFIPELEKPLLQGLGWGVLSDASAFDRILVWGSAQMPGGFESRQSWDDRLSPGGRAVVVDVDLLAGPRLTPWIPEQLVDAPVLQRLTELENGFLGTRDSADRLQSLGFTLTRFSVPGTKELDPETWKAWWTPGRPGSWPEYLLQKAPDLASWMELIGVNSRRGPVSWNQSWTLAVLEKGASS